MWGYQTWFALKHARGPLAFVFMAYVSEVLTYFVFPAGFSLYLNGFNTQQ